MPPPTTTACHRTTTNMHLRDVSRTHQAKHPGAFITTKIKRLQFLYHNTFPNTLQLNRESPVVSCTLRHINYKILPQHHNFTIQSWPRSWHGVARGELIRGPNITIFHPPLLHYHSLSTLHMPFWFLLDPTTWAYASFWSQLWGKRRDELPLAKQNFNHDSSFLWPFDPLSAPPQHEQPRPTINMEITPRWNVA